MNPELAKILGRDLNPVPGSESVPMALLATEPVGCRCGQSHEAEASHVEARAKPPKPPRLAAPGRAASALPAISRLDMLAGLREYGSWKAFALASNVNPRTMTRWAERYRIEALPKADLTRELLAPAIAEYGSWKAVARALKRREGAVLEGGPCPWPRCQGWSQRCRRAGRLRQGRLQPQNGGAARRELQRRVQRAAQAAAGGAGMTSLFVRRDFVSHGGLALSWKVECDALTSSDWLTLASIVAGWGLRFGHVVGVPQGGLRFADALRPHVTAGVETTLIADDVLTTGGSMGGDALRCRRLHRRGRVRAGHAAAMGARRLADGDRAMTTLREAARALLARWDDLPDRVTPNLAYLLVDCIQDIRAALDAPPPGLEEVWATAEEIWLDGWGEGHRHGDTTESDVAERDRLIAELLAMVEARQPCCEDDLK
jgi:hypothetical protein